MTELPEESMKPKTRLKFDEYEMECVINVALSSYKCCRSRNNCLFNFVIFDGSINQQNLIPDDFLTSVFINTEFICDTF